MAPWLQKISFPLSLGHNNPCFISLSQAPSSTASHDKTITNAAVSSTPATTKKDKQ
jgi:hypothetical protein